MSDIPGQHDARDLYAALSVRHRPSDPAALATECRRLHRTGLKPSVIAQALRLDLVAVLHALHGPVSIPPTT